MAGTPQRRARKQAALSRLAEPAYFGSMLTDIAGGLTLSEWCRKHDSPYNLTHEFIHADPQRLKFYTAALERRGDSLTDRFVAGVRTVTDADPRHAFDKSGSLLPMHKLPDSVAMATDGLETTYDKQGNPTTKLRLVPKGRALELLGRHLGAFRDKLDVDVKIGMADRLKAARERVLARSKS